MSGEPVLLDSVIVIDHLNGNRKATAFLNTVSGRAHVSPITRAEVLVGVSVDQAPAVRMLLDSFATVVLDTELADLAAELRRMHRWFLPDAFQAACALAHGWRLATRNTKDFPPSRHAFVLVPYRI